MTQPVDSPGPPAAVILAGGASRRMGGRPKSLLPLAGKPLLWHVIERIRPQAGSLYLSVERTTGELAEFGLPQVADPELDAGPLAGLLAVLGQMEAGQDWLLLVPCDAPFLPRDLAEKLLSRALESGLPGAVVQYQSELQPTFSIWNRSLLPSLERSVSHGKMRGFKEFLRVSELAVLDWPGDEPPPFYNINEAADLRQAESLLKHRQGVTKSCSA